MDLREYWSVWRVLGHFSMLICLRNRLSILLEWFASAKPEYISSVVDHLHFRTTSNELKEQGYTVADKPYVKQYILTSWQTDNS